MNSKQLDQIIQDLLAVDPSLTPDQLRPVVEKLIQEKPEVQIDEKFRVELFARLQEEIGRVKRIEPTTINYNFMKKINWILAGSTLVAIAALIYTQAPQGNLISLPGDEEITRMSANAFGPLTELTIGRGQGGGGSAMALSETDKIASPLLPPGSGGGSGIDPAFAPTYYNYTYQGQPFTIDSPLLPVYQRQKGFSGSADLQSFLQRFNVGLFDINKFADAQLEYLRASENKDFGYAINLDMKEGVINIDQNWERWQSAYPQCQDEACYNRTRIQESDLPSDEEAIAIANQFLDEYAINRTSFGEPVVQNSWRAELARATDTRMIYLPDNISVVYPLKIEGNEIYDEGGNKTGLYVSINVRVDKVSNVGALTNLRFQGSDYQLEQDSAKIISIAQRGGLYSYIPLAENLEPNASVKTLELGDPQRVYMRLWRHQNNQSVELFVPALVFPIINPPADVYQKNVIVPLVKEILDSPQYDGPVRIMQ